MGLRRRSRRGGRGRRASAVVGERGRSCHWVVGEELQHCCLHKRMPPLLRCHSGEQSDEEGQQGGVRSLESLRGKCGRFFEWSVGLISIERAREGVEWGEDMGAKGKVWVCL